MKNHMDRVASTRRLLTVSNATYERDGDECTVEPVTNDCFRDHFVSRVASLRCVALCGIGATSVCLRIPFHQNEEMRCSEFDMVCEEPSILIIG